MRSQRSRIFLSFQPTRPLRGATLLTLIRFASLLYFNPRAPCGARPTRHPLIFNLITFQPTRPLRGATYINLPIDKGQLFQPTRPLRGATGLTGLRYGSLVFQPTRPLRGATKHELERRLSNNISTHAPLAGRDVDDATVAGVNSDFNPRAPCGARLSMSLKGDCRIIFQPTRPLRGATSMTLPLLVLILISTHAPLAGRDRMLDQSDAFDNYFNPRAPCGARLACLPFDTAAKDFNPRAPCGARRE